MVPRQQILGLCFIRWYNIAAKCYELDHQYEQRSVKQQPSAQFLGGEHLRLMQINYQLCKTGCLLELKNQVSHRLIVFRQTELLDKDRRVLQKTNKIVFNIKHYSDHAYRQFIKQMRASSKAR